MITLAALDIRRLCRRRLSLLLLVVPVALVLGAVVLKMLGRTFPSHVIWLCVITSSLLIFCQAALSDREGRLDLALVTARVSPRLPLLRRAFLLVVPAAFQFAVYSLLAAVFGIT